MQHRPSIEPNILYVHQ